MSNKKARKALRKAEKAAYAKKYPDEVQHPPPPAEVVCQHIGKGRFESIPPQCMGCGKFLPPELVVPPPPPPPPAPSEQRSREIASALMLAATFGAGFSMTRRRRY